ncbi:uncharacterized protein FSUBG_4770 [Fusarium subglutinans]|uniref:Uncharacterized protein n=1 Tax=Gibberella subglutinans TaxID=42677 RepID=A0A8H5Q4R6_GIBSU|nr:uncharacterized protein FSUBG_4770 [Fusarium subglutinans]KAF5608234.1 hypothetical protein FSUBG_4770 [Fusarium subglutinans]
MSTDLEAYLNYMLTWEDETDDNINAIITEQSLFLSVGTYDSTTAVSTEFSTLVSLAETLAAETVAADAIQIAADVAAVASIWSFGISMMIFAEAEITALLLSADISSKSTELNNKMATVDTDISAQINDQVSQYITQYKTNNVLIASKATEGLDTRHCRSILLQFVAQVQRHTGNQLNADNFRKYAHVARQLYESKEIDAIYAALDTLYLSDQTEADLTQYMDTIKGLGLNTALLTSIHLFSVAFMANRLSVANDTLRNVCIEGGMDPDMVDVSAFEMLDGLGKLVVVVGAVMSVADAVMQIIDIVDVVEQAENLRDAIEGKFQTNYLNFFNGISEASQKYNNALQNITTPSSSIS